MVENHNTPPAEQKKFEYLPYSKASLFEKAMPWFDCPSDFEVDKSNHEVKLEGERIRQENIRQAKAKLMQDKTFQENLRYKELYGPLPKKES